jgi:hypothetical protein
MPYRFLFTVTIWNEIYLPIKSVSMIPTTISSNAYFFKINHITRETYDRYIYGISLNGVSYFISKTVGMNNSIQLDTNPPLEKNTISEISNVLEGIEPRLEKPPSPEMSIHSFKFIDWLLNHIPGLHKTSL